MQLRATPNDDDLLQLFFKKGFSTAACVRFAQYVKLCIYGNVDLLVMKPSFKKYSTERGTSVGRTIILNYVSNEGNSTERRSPF